MLKQKKHLPGDFRTLPCAKNRGRIGFLLLFCALIFAGCSTQKTVPQSLHSEAAADLPDPELLPSAKAPESSEEKNPELNSLPISGVSQDSSQGSGLDQLAPSILSKDWSDYFGVLNGAAVLYEPVQNRYQIYGGELASVRRSPCSTFKIISSLIALEHGIIDPEHSIRTWSGEQFWNEAWNRDIDFMEAFHTSCVWYFRQVIDEIGPELMQAELDKLHYGNGDISDWGGRLNNNNNNRALTGFWIESSLKISPKEQTEVMAQIFGPDSAYNPETLHHLEQAMLVFEDSELPYSIYGKTGMGKTSGVVVDAWFTGFSRTSDETVYFCVYLGETAGADVSSTKAKEIAKQMIADYWNK